MATHSALAAPGGTLRDQVAGDVRALLAYRKISGNSLAARIGMSQKWVSRRLNGEVAFDVDDLQVIANELGVDVRILMGIQLTASGARPSGGKVASAERALRLVPSPRRVSPPPQSPRRPLLQVLSIVDSSSGA